MPAIADIFLCFSISFGFIFKIVNNFNLHTNMALTETD
jgi:hypothetical protein